MILLAPILILVLIAFLRGKHLIWLGVIFLVWFALALVPDLFDAQELDKKLNGALVYFSMYGGIFGIPIGTICIVSGIIKMKIIKTPNQSSEPT